METNNARTAQYNNFCAPYLALDYKEVPIKDAVRKYFNHTPFHHPRTSERWIMDRIKEADFLKPNKRNGRWYVNGNVVDIFNFNRFPRSDHFPSKTHIRDSLDCRDDVPQHATMDDIKREISKVSIGKSPSAAPSVDGISTATSDTRYNLVGEDRQFGGNMLYKDLIPSTTWFNNVRSCVSQSSWDKLRKQVYERVDYKCECCNTDCRFRKSYTGDDYATDKIFPSSEFKAEVELNKWNTIQMEAHERWSYDYESKAQKLERIIALCHRCHSATHLGFAGLRGVHILAMRHMKQVNGWDDKQLHAHCNEQQEVWRKRNQVQWTLHIDIITNSGFQVVRKTKSQ